MQHKSILCFLLLTLPFLLPAQNSKLFTADRELSSSLINKIYQDSDGMIWVATEDGLNRYDGTKFSVYKHESSNQNSLMHNFVRCLFQDSKGHLLIGCYNGVQLYDPATDSFSAPAVREDGSPFSSNINMILQRKNGDIWLSGNELSLLKICGDKLIAKSIDLPIGTTITDYFMEDRIGNMWVVTNENNIFCLTNDGTLIHHPIDNDNALVTALNQDQDGGIYAGTIADGLFCLDMISGVFVPVSTENSLSIKALYPGSHNEMYIGTDGNGLKIYDRILNRIADSPIDNSNFDLAKSKIHSIIKDSEGNFWLAIYQKGVMMIPAQSNNFKYIGYKSVNKNVIGSCCVTALLKDKNNLLWVGTDTDGIYCVAEDGQKSRHYTGGKGKNSIPSIVINLFEDSNQDIWCGSFTSGMGKIDKKTGEFLPLGLYDEHKTLIRRVYCIAEDNDKRLWIATMGGGLFCYDLKTKKVHMPDVLQNDKWISCLLFSKEENKLYVGGYNGVTLIDLQSEDYKSETFLTGQIIYSLYQDANKKIWISSSEGLMGRDENNPTQIRKYTMQNGLPSDVVYAVLEDEYNNLWISTDAGISQFNLSTEMFINYFVGDGLQGNEFSKNTAYKESNGTLWFGGVNGITYFNPKEIINPARKWTVNITDLYLHNIPVRKGMKSGKYQIIDRPVYDAESFNLSYKDNSFTVEFSTREYNSPERISYMYSMNNGDWVVLRSGVNRITFSDLHPGIYSLKIRAKDYDLLSDIKEIKIAVSTPWYSTIWAWLGYMVLVLIIAYVVYLQIRHRIRVKKQMMDHLHAEEINEAKLQFFINISHEIRTPMTLIISPLKKLMKTDVDDDRQRSYRTIYRNSERILGLVNQLMDIRKIDKGQMSLKFRETEMVNYLKELCESFEYQLSAKEISLKYPEMDNLVNVWIDPKNFDKIILNLLSNALKFTPRGGDVQLSIAVKEDVGRKDILRNYVEITISDSGIGIDESQMSRIFERFYQIHNDLNTMNLGTGIGLHLTRSLVELHHGTISVCNNENGVGCRFIIKLPLYKDHLRPEELETIELAITNHQEDDFSVAPIIEDETKKQKSKTKHRVVLVEDDEEIRRYIVQELSADFHIIECANGKEALPIIIKKNPSLVISDVMMPEMDGMTLCRKIKQNVNTNHVPVLMLTAKTGEDDTIDALELGADAYMTKPFSIDMLRKTAENLIRNREVLRNCYTGNQEKEAKVAIIEIQSTDNKLMDRIMNVINKNLSNQELNVEMITREVGISRVHLHRKLKELTNQSTRDLIKNVRLKHAATLLTTTHYNITEITDMVGFSSVTLFSRSFKELYGMTPTEYAEVEVKNKV